jgi:hypothetical protein
MPDAMGNPLSLDDGGEEPEGAAFWAAAATGLLWIAFQEQVTEQVECRKERNSRVWGKGPSC